MFSRNREQTALDIALDKAMKELSRHKVGSDEYNKVLENVIKIHAMKVKDKPDSLSLDTLVLAASNLVGILLIIGHEQIGNVLTSKALGLLIRPRP